MKLRLAPILISVAVTALVLFGGWFIYNSVAMKDPLVNLAEPFPGVEEVSVRIQDQAVNMTLTLSHDADIANIVSTLRREGASIIGSRELKLDIIDRSNEELDAWWSKALFDIAEAMEARRYGEIPAILDSHAQALDGLDVNTSIDDQYVYVQMKQGEFVKFALLERMPAMMGVWSNE
jgi:hypothetical protein